MHAAHPGLTLCRPYPYLELTWTAEQYVDALPVAHATGGLKMGIHSHAIVGLGWTTTISSL